MDEKTKLEIRLLLVEKLESWIGAVDEIETSHPWFAEELPVIMADACMGILQTAYATAKAVKENG